MAHVKAGGQTRLGRDSQSKRLGVKKFAGQTVKAGNIIVRQRGTKYRAGKNAKIGSDDTLFSKIDGFVNFRFKRVKRMDNSFRETLYVDILPTAKKTA